MEYRGLQNKATVPDAAQLDNYLGWRRSQVLRGYKSLCDAPPGISRYLDLVNILIDKLFSSLSLPLPSGIEPSSVLFADYKENPDIRYADCYPEIQTIVLANVPLPLRTRVDQLIASGRFSRQGVTYKGVPSKKEMILPSSWEKGIDSLLLADLLHECLHLVSGLKFFLDGRKIRKNFIPYRTGIYELNDQGFDGFNDAIIEKTSGDLLVSYKEFIRLHSGVDFRFSRRQLFYKPHMELLDHIIRGIQSRTGLPRSESWRRLQATVFSGDMMGLRIIEGTFGKGSLRVLRMLSSVDGKPPLMDMEEINSLVARFFAVKGYKEKEALAKRLLPKEEFIEYQARHRVIDALG